MLFVNLRLCGFTDFRNSVIGKVNFDGSVDKITYNAWGTPSIAAGADLEGLSILWNGYYYDTETNNYYLRNRYYSPEERQFITQDMHGLMLYVIRAEKVGTQM